LQVLGLGTNRRPQNRPGRFQAGERLEAGNPAVCPPPVVILTTTPRLRLPNMVGAELLRRTPAFGGGIAKFSELAEANSLVIYSTHLWPPTILSQQGDFVIGMQTAYDFRVA
jgi:hypothetical protein